MNITFLVGNGFDIACGIDTSYSAFYKWYLEQPSSSTAIRNMKKDIQINRGNWSDFEMGLEKYSRLFRTDNIENFFDCYEDAQKRIIEFLKMQTSKIIFDKIDYKQLREFKNNIIFFYKDLSAVEREINKNNMLYYNFISFNYTQILNRLLEKVSKLSEGFVDDKVIKSQVINIHGTLTKTPLLGVSQEHQINNVELLKDSLFRKMMIKPNAVKAIGESWYDDAIELIGNSDVICIFGMSLGNSDSILWRRIIYRLNNSLNCHLIIFWYTDNPPGNISIRNIISKNNKIQDIILKYADLNPEKADKLKERIHIVFNTRRVLQIDLSQANINDDNNKLLKV